MTEHNEQDDTPRAAEGRISIGPMRVSSVAEAIALLASHNLHVPRGTHAQVTARGTGTLDILAQGEGVLGYLVDSDGLEASRSDLEEFARRLLLPDEKLLISGHHYVAENRVVICRMKVHLDDEGEILFEQDRHVYSHGCGARRLVEPLRAAGRR